jgi:hypothetical protein
MNNGVDVSLVPMVSRLIRRRRNDDDAVDGFTNGRAVDGPGDKHSPRPVFSSPGNFGDRERLLPLLLWVGDNGVDADAYIGVGESGVDGAPTLPRRGRDDDAGAAPAIATASDDNGDDDDGADDVAPADDGVDDNGIMAGTATSKRLSGLAPTGVSAYGRPKNITQRPTAFQLATRGTHAHRSHAHTHGRAWSAHTMALFVYLMNYNK